MQWISLELDGEIALLEEAALARHLQRCERCRAVRAAIAGFTRAMREAPAEERARPVAIAGGRRRAVRAGLAAFAAAALVATAIAGGLTTAPSSSKPEAWALGFSSQRQQLEFARVHVSTEPTLDGADVPPAGSLGWRALR